MNLAELNCFLSQYYQEVRTALFITGFTLGTFLFSMKSVIVKTMKDEYYDNDDYQETIRQRRKLGDNIGYYSNLKNFSSLLVWSIWFAFIGALSQITIGFIENIFAMSFAILIVIVSWILVGVSIYYVSKNWSMFLEFAENQTKDKLD